MNTSAGLGCFVIAICMLINPWVIAVVAPVFLWMCIDLNRRYDIGQLMLEPGLRRIFCTDFDRNDESDEVQPRGSD